MVESALSVSDLIFSWMKSVQKTVRTGKNVMASVPAIADAANPRVKINIKWLCRSAMHPGLTHGWRHGGIRFTGYYSCSQNPFVQLYLFFVYMLWYMHSSDTVLLRETPAVYEDNSGVSQTSSEARLRWCAELCNAAYFKCNHTRKVSQPMMKRSVKHAFRCICLYPQPNWSLI